MQHSSTLGAYQAFVNEYNLLKLFLIRKLSKIWFLFIVFFYIYTTVYSSTNIQFLTFYWYIIIQL